MSFGINTAASPAQEQPTFDHIVVFGDSLSDMGNAGRFSNGPVWVEQLADKLHVTLRPSDHGGENFAIGGARLDPKSGPDSLRAQVDRFLQRKALPEGRTLYIVWGGSNDIFAALDERKALAQLDTAAESLKSIVADLVQNGAQDLLVPNLADVGMTPEVRAQGRKAVEEARRLTEHLNKTVDNDLAALNSSASNTFKVHRLDVWSLAEQARKQPSSFGLRNVTSPCKRLRRCDGHLFWDDIHPTTEGHARLAAAALDALDH